MDEKLRKILNKINLDEKYFPLFNNAKILKNNVDELNNIINIEIYNENDISYELYQELIDKFSIFFDGATIKLKIVNNSLICDNFEENLKKALELNKFPNIDALISNIEINNNSFKVSVVNEREKNDLEKEIKLLEKYLSLYGTHFDYEIIIDDDKRITIDKNIISESTEIESKPYVFHEETKQSTMSFPRRRKKDVDEKTLFGNRIKDDEAVTDINSVNEPKKGLVIEAKIFGKKEFVPASKAFKILTLNVTDNTNSIMAKIFVRDDELYDKLLEKLSDGTWWKFKGDTSYDEYEKHELVLTVYDIYESSRTDLKRKDEAPRKRIELHTHTMMSQMDGLIDEGVLVKQAISWGMPGIAITDHDGCQAFPVVFGAVTDYNKSQKKKIDEKIKENEASLEELKQSENPNEEGIKQIEDFIKELKDEKENYKPFKALYGVELDMCDSTLDVCFNPNKEKIEDATYVVFDTETTGFNPGLGNSMIELGGVKIDYHGQIIDRFNSLINPGVSIDPEITRVTNITNEDVKHAPSEKEVVLDFKKWIGNLPLVAHNARFDKNMLDMAYFKYDLGKLENPIIDTLMLSRIINRDQKKHSLKALGKLYGVDTGEADDEDKNNDTASKDKKIDENEIKDILVDGESVLRTINVEYNDTEISTEEVVRKTRKEYYLPVVYKEKNTEKVNVEIKLSDDCSLTGFNSEQILHPAENEISISYMTPFVPKTITLTIYVGAHHGADVDSENTAIIFAKMLKQIEGIKSLDELNNLGLLEEVAIKNNPKYIKDIYDVISYKNYIRPLLEDEELSDKDNLPLEKYGNNDYVWKYPCCKEDNLQMYENIPAKTFTENLANIFDRTKHITLIAKDQTGLKNLFKIVSFANTNFVQKNARIPRKLVNEYREGILVGSACLNGEIFDIALSRNEEELIEYMKFYDYIEVQPIENYEHLLRGHDINNLDELKKGIKKIIDCATKAGKIVVATGDVHILNDKDNIYREIIVNQNVPGKGRHSLARYLEGYPKNNNNQENIERLLTKAKQNGVELNVVDEKVIMYLYALQGVPSVPAIAKNISTLYVPDSEQELLNEGNKSKNKKESFDIDDESEKDSKDKLEIIDSSLRKLQIGGLIDFDYDKGSYVLSDYNRGTPYKEGHIPSQFFRTTDEMINSFKWLNDDKLIEEIVIDNTYKIYDQVDVLEVILHPHKPFSPIIENSQEICRDLVYTKAQSMYGDPLPRNIEERIAEEFYGGVIHKLVDDYIKEKNPDIDEEEKEKIYSSSIHEVIMKGFDFIVSLYAKRLKREDEELSDEDAVKKAKDSLSGIIGGGFDVIYLIAQKLVKHSNDRGYLVGSRGSVGSSFVASMMGITECNSLPPHYYCPKCQYSMFKEEDGKDFSFIDENGEETLYLSGFDLPERTCPKCGADLIHQGNDMPFATFLGFQGEKVPDIDLNFSGEDQSFAHEYTKELFGIDNVYRAGTIGTVADKTAYGFVQGYFEMREYDRLLKECASYSLKIPSDKVVVKDEKIIKSNIRPIEVERLALGCTGVKRTTGQHPGGIVVVPGYKDVFDFTPFQYPADDATSAWRTTHFDYHKIEDDLLKLDILGHDDPTVLKMLQDLSGIDVTGIDLGDRDTMSIFTGPEILGVKKEQLRGLENKATGQRYCPTGTLGIPEFGTSFLLGMLEETKPKTFAELIKISGLSHGTDVWLNNAQDLIRNKVVPFSKVIGCRDDIMVNLIAWGVPANKAFKIMEFVRKGKPSKSPKDWEEHVKTLKEYNIPDYYINSCQKIKYMFPKAHATAYVTSAFRIAWFKVHHPIIYYCAYLSIRCDKFDIQTMIQGERAIRAKIDEIYEKEKPSDKDIEIRETLQICLEAACRGIYFKNIDLNKSDAKNFIITEDQKGLIIPFRALDGLGESVALSVVKAREESPFVTQEDLKDRSKLSKTTIEQLKKLGCLNDLPESNINQLSLFG